MALTVLRLELGRSGVMYGKNRPQLTKLSNNQVEFGSSCYFGGSEFQKIPKYQTSPTEVLSSYQYEITERSGILRDEFKNSRDNERDRSKRAPEAGWDPSGVLTGRPGGGGCRPRLRKGRGSSFRSHSVELVSEKESNQVVCFKFFLFLD